MPFALLFCVFVELFLFNKFHFIYSNCLFALMTCCATAITSKTRREKKNAFYLFKSIYSFSLFVGRTLKHSKAFDSNDAKNENHILDKLKAFCLSKVLLFDFFFRSLFLLFEFFKISIDICQLCYMIL